MVAVDDVKLPLGAYLFVVVLFGRAEHEDPIQK